MDGALQSCGALFLGAIVKVGVEAVIVQCKEAR